MPSATPSARLTLSRPFSLGRLRERLRRAAFKRDCQDFFHGDLVDSLPYLIALCASGSTFRAYRATRHRPSHLFRSWAMSCLVKRVRSPERAALFDSPTLSRLHRLLRNSLSSYWYNHDGTRLSFAQENKLIDLFLRHAVLWSALPEKRRRWLLAEANVPLDKFTLHYISQIAKAHGIAIPPGASMGFINKENYKSIQRAIRVACYGHPPLHFDILAWNQDHRDIIHKQLHERCDPVRVRRRSDLATEAFCMLTKRTT